MVRRPFRLLTTTPPIEPSPPGWTRQVECCAAHVSARLPPPSEHSPRASTLRRSRRCVDRVGRRPDCRRHGGIRVRVRVWRYLYSKRAETVRPGVQSSCRRGKGRRRFFLRGPRDVTKVQPSRFLIRRNRKVSHLRPPQPPISRTAGASAFGQSALGADSSN